MSPTARTKAPARKVAERTKRQKVAKAKAAEIKKTLAAKQLVRKTAKPAEKGHTPAPAPPKPAKSTSRPQGGPLGAGRRVAAAGRKPALAKPPFLAKKPATEQKAPVQLKGIRIRLSAFDYRVLDEACMKIVDTAIRTGAVVHGPIPLPTKIHKYTVNRSTFKHKDARDQFEMRIHRRLIDLSDTTFKTVDALQNLSLPAGVNIEIKMG